MALLVWPNTQTSMDKKEPTIPAAAKDATPFTGILPTIAVSVIDNSGSAMPAIVAGIASLLIVLNETIVLLCTFTKLIHNSRTENCFVLENIYYLIFDNL